MCKCLVIRSELIGVRSGIRVSHLNHKYINSGFKSHIRRNNCSTSWRIFFFQNGYEIFVYLSSGIITCMRGR